jgi:hypothetical protein
LSKGEREPAAPSRAWHAHDEVPSLPPDEGEALHAQRQVAQRCLYGVDKNPMATDLAKLSLWLATLAKDHSFTFLDHSLRVGDSLVGLTRKQAASFSWSDSQSVLLDLERELRTRIELVSLYRKQILESGDDVPYASRKQKLATADESLVFPRLSADTVIAAFFSAEKPRARENAVIRLRAHAEAILWNPTNSDAGETVEASVARLRHGSKGIMPFHWGLEFPEVFSLDVNGEQTGGFDAIVGNPPFAGKNTLIDAHREGYLDWLKAIHKESHGNADLVAHFFRRAFNLLRKEGSLGLIATNTIAQGDTRSTGLRWISRNGGTIYRATKRLKWPGEAAVVVSVVHIFRGSLPGPYALNGRSVDRITAFLFHAGGNDDPVKLAANADQSFQGSIVLGMGFTFDDSDTKRVASSIADMRRLIEKDPSNGERIFPYLGGEEVNNSPTHAHHRYVINFEDFPLERKTSGPSWFELTKDMQQEQLQQGIVALDYPGQVAEDWPDLLDIVRERVKPVRELDNREVRRRGWWKFAEKAVGLSAATKALSRVLVHPFISSYLAFAFVPSNVVVAGPAYVFAIPHYAGFCCLQSRIHEVWARFLSATLEDRLSYAPSDCFDPFPFPENLDGSAALEESGEIYYNYRAALMIRSDKGLTKIYNRFHDPNDELADIKHLRELHASMDRAVLDAYGWQDLQPTYDFFSEFDEEEDGGRARRKYRYRWSDEIHDEVLARLLDLNRQRAREEGQLLVVQQSPSAAIPKPKSKVIKKNGRNSSDPGSTANLFGTEEEKV